MRFLAGRALAVLAGALLVPAVALIGPAALAGDTPPGEATGSAEPATVAVLPFDLIDSSLRAEIEGHPLEADLARLAMARDIVVQRLDAAPEFEVIDNAPARKLIQQGLDRNLYLYRCNGCAMDIGRKLGADLVLLGWAQKVSNLILNINGVIREVGSLRDVAGASVDLRGNTDETWKQAANRLAGNLLSTYAATMAEANGTDP